MGAGLLASMKYHYFHRFFTYSIKQKREHSFSSGTNIVLWHCDLHRGQCQVGSLTGAVHLSNGNAGVLRQAQRGQKPRVEQKGKCLLDLDFQYEYRQRNLGLSILLPLRVLSKRCQKSYQRDNWLVAAKRS